MCDVPVLFATTEGQTRRVAERLAETLRARGLSSVAIDVSSAQARSLDWQRARGAFVCGSLHAGRHQKAVGDFAKARASELNAIPSVFVSVSLSVASKHERERDAARRVADEFATAPKWRPLWVACVAGRLAYTQYGFFTRWFMKRIARHAGGPTDTSRDHELTDWLAVERLANHLADHVCLEMPKEPTRAGVAKTA